MEDSIFLICKDFKGIVPLEIQVIPFGYHKTPRGDFLMDAESAEMVINSFAAHKNDMVIDYEHQTLKDLEAPAAGWIKKLINKGKEGIWAAVEWTEKAKTYIENKEYRFVSPVFFARRSDKKITRMLNVAMTNLPNIDGMVPIVNKGVTIPLDITSKKEEAQMKNLLKLLGLGDDASEDDAISAVKKLNDQSQIIANKAVLDALGLKGDAAESEVTGTIIAMKQAHGQTDSLAQTVAELQTKLAKRDADELVILAMKEGKITPAQKEWAGNYAETDPKGFKVFVNKAPVVVHTRNISGNDPPPDKTGALDEATMIVAKAFGNTEEDIKKYGLLN